MVLIFPKKKLFTSFCECSGLKMNIQKTKAVWLDESKNLEKLQKTYTMEWVTELNLEAITFDLDLERMLDTNILIKV